MGRYVIADYLRQYGQDPSPELRAAILKVAHAAIDRMEPLKDALVFWYTEAMQVSRQPAKHYSGLTQAYYAEILFQAYQATGDESLREASEKTFRSLLIPQAEGGVYDAWEDGRAGGGADLPERPDPQRLDVDPLVRPPLRGAHGFGRGPRPVRPEFRHGREAPAAV